MKNLNKVAIIAILFLVTVTLAGCEALPGNLSSDGTGQIVMSVADAPETAADNVFVSIDEVKIHNSDNDEWITLNDFESEENGTLKVDLLKLRFKELKVSDTEVPEGNYDQIRLELDAAKDTGGGENPSSANTELKYTIGGTEYTKPIFIPSEKFIIDKENSKNGFDGFQVDDNSLPTDIVLDFDVSFLMDQINSDGSIHQRDFLLLRPTAIEVVNNNETESIVGEVVKDDQTVTEEVKIELYNSDTDELIKSTYTCTGEGDGEVGHFKLRGVEVGDYTVKASITLDNIDYTGEKEVQITEEDVETKKPKNINEIVLTEVTQ